MPFMSHDVSHRMVTRLKLDGSSRENFYSSLNEQLGGCPGFITHQKNTQEMDEITILVSGSGTFTVCLGNVEFCTYTDLDISIQMALAYHKVFDHPFSEANECLAKFLGSVLGIDHGSPNRRVQMCIDKMQWVCCVLSVMFVLYKCTVFLWCVI